MKRFYQMVILLGMIWVSGNIVVARIIQPWSYQQLLDKSDLVVIATPTATGDTKEHIALPGFEGQRVAWCRDKVCRCPRCSKVTRQHKDLALHHYRPGRKGNTRRRRGGIRAHRSQRADLRLF